MPGHSLLAAALIALCAPFAALAQSWGGFDSAFDEEDKPWREIEARLPAYPDPAQAIEFDVSAATDNRFFIDPKSISIGEDGVVRYTLIVRSSAGALTVSFEGLRCETRETKLYAFGRPDGTWSRNKHARWTRVEPKVANRQHSALYMDYFCPFGDMVATPNEAINALKRGGHPRRDTY